MARLVFEYTKKGDGAYNEDRLGAKGSFAWVIDGATDVFNKAVIEPTNEVGWYVDRLNAEIWERCTSSGSLSDLLNDSVMAIQSSISPRLNPATTPEYWLPNFAIALVQIDRRNLNYFVLGDCIVAISCRDRVKVLTDHRIAKFSDMNHKKLGILRANGASSDEIRHALQETRKYANAENGYPIGSFYGSGVAQGICGSVELEDSCRILMCTDGMKEFFDTIPGSLSGMLGAVDYQSEIDKVDAFYSDSALYSANPRPKRVDDQALLIMEV